MNLNCLRVFRLRRFSGIAPILLAALDTGKLLDPSRLLLMTLGSWDIFQRFFNQRIGGLV